MINFEEQCPNCNGKGEFFGKKSYNNEICERCSGRGLILSEFGKEYIETLKWYLSEYFVRKENG